MHPATARSGPQPVQLVAEPSATAAVVALQVGRWRFDAEVNQLADDHQQIHLEPRLAELLSFLIARGGRVASKQQLVEQVWEDRFVTDSALTRAVAELRRALGDDAHAPRYIETIPKRGYRLIAAVSPLSTAAVEESGADQRTALIEDHGHLGPTVPTTVPPWIGPLSKRGRRMLTAAAITALSLAGWLLSRGVADRADRQLFDPPALHKPLLAGSAAIRSSPTAAPGALASHRPSARQLADRGYALLAGADHAGLHQALDLFRGAIDLDLSYAPAHAGLADSYHRLTLCELLPPGDGFPKARAAALEALRLDPSLSRAHVVLANVRFLFDWDWPAAELEFLRAVQLAPDDPEVAEPYAFYLTCMGRFTEAIAEAQRALELAPASSRQRNALGWVYFNARQFDHSLAVLRQEPDASYDEYIAWNLALLGEHHRATEMLERAAARKADPVPIFLGTLGWSLAQSGRTEQARELLAELQPRRPHSWAELYPLSLVHAALGEADQAFYWLDRAIEERSLNLIFLKVEPFLDPIRDDPRYHQLLQRLGLGR